MSTEVIDMVSHAASFAREPLTEAQRAAFQAGQRVRAARAAASLAVTAQLSPNGPHSPASDAEVLLAAGFFPVGSIQSPDYVAAPPGIANI